MLVAFLKGPQDTACECEVVRYCDRVWFDAGGSAVILRQFIIGVRRGSLSQIDMLLPFEHMYDVTNLGRVSFDKTFPFNGFTTAGKYEVQEPFDDKGLAEDYGIIQRDGFNNILVYPNSPVEVGGCGKCKMLSFFFPESLGETQLSEIVVGFNVRSLFDNVAINPEHPEYQLSLQYLVRAGHEKDLDFCVADEREIPIHSSYGPPDYKGGFDVFLYLPEGFKAGSFTQNGQVSKDRYKPDGSEGVAVQKIGWRARRFETIGENALIKSGPGFDICLDLGPENHQVEVKIDGVAQAVKTGNNRANWALTIAILGILISIAGIFIVLFAK